MTIVIDMQNPMAQKRTVLIGNMIRLASSIERGTTWNVPPLSVAKREGWTIKSADKYRALVDQVEFAQRSFGYRLDPKTTLGKAYVTSKAALASRKAAKKSKALV